MNKITTLAMVGILAHVACKAPVRHNSAGPFRPSANLSYTAFNNLYHEGNDLYVYSQETGWTFTVDFGNKAAFTSADGSRYVFRADHVLELPDDATQGLIFEEGTNRLSLKLEKQDCNDPQHDFINPYSAEIRLNEVMYKGCGLFLYDKKINGYWAFSTFNGKSIALSGSKNRRLFIDADLHTMHGVFDCDSMYSILSVQNDKLLLEHVSATRLNCKEMVKEQAFSGIFQQVNRYQLRGDSVLVLKGNDNEFLFERMPAR